MLKLFKEREGERQEFVEDLMRLVTKQAEASDGLLISNFCSSVIVKL